MSEFKKSDDVESVNSSKFASYAKNTVAILEVVDSEDETPLPGGEGSFSP